MTTLSWAFMFHTEEFSPDVKTIRWIFSLYPEDVRRTRRSAQLTARGLPSPFHADRLLLRLQAQLCRAKGVLLRHRALGSLEAVEDQLAEEGIADLAGHRDVVLSAGVHQVHVVARALPAHVDVL